VALDEKPESWTNGLVSWEAWQAASADVARRLHAK